MKRPKRIFVIADFKTSDPTSIRLQSRMFVKGLIRLGHDVQCFSYPNIAMQFSRFQKKSRALKSGKSKADTALVDQIRAYGPDMILLMVMKYIDAESIQRIRQVVSNTPIIGHDEDAFPASYPERLKLAKETDMMICTGAGQFLQDYKDVGVKRVAFLPNVCDSDIQYRYPLEDKFTADVIYTGKVTHARLGGGGDREWIIEKLRNRPNCRIYGAFGAERVQGLDYFRAISSAKIGLSVNYTNSVQMYHSDRLVNYLACGTFVLASRVPDTEQLFKDKIHLRYFETEQECFELADWYLSHEDERETIAAAGMAYAHEQYNPTRMAGYLLDLADGRDVDTPWKVII